MIERSGSSPLLPVRRPPYAGTIDPRADLARLPRVVPKTFDGLDDLVGGNDAVADRPAAPGEPGHAEELDELAEIGDSLRPEGRELDDRPGPDGLLPWRQGYPYEAKLSRREYERTKRRLQIELLKLQAHVKDTGQKVAVLFEGRDAAG